MAHFAQVFNGVVQQVIVVADADCGGGQMPESEQAGQEFIAQIISLGSVGEWLQTSYNNNFRSRYAGIGYTYDAVLDEFVAPIAPV